MNEPVLFQSLNAEEKINFFAKCQEILIKNHPESPFLFTNKNVQSRLDYFKDFYNKYNGFCYRNEKICLLFNKIKLKDPHDPISAVKENMWKAPNENYNCFIIDFVVFVELRDCLNFCQQQYKPEIKYIVFARNNDIKIYETEKLLKKLNNSFI